MRESFRFFKTFLDTGKALPSAELQAQFFIALAEYALEGKEPEDPMLQALLVAPKFTIDKSEAISASASERGKLWWRPKKSFWTTQKAPKANESCWKLSKTTESEVEVENKNKESKEKFWAFVLLTQNEHTKLLEIFWEKRLNQEIEKLNNYIWSKGTKYKSHYFTIRKRNEDFILKQKNKEPPKNSCERQSAGDLDPIIS